ncbi:MAG TPA: ATP-binding cassette domain-containing protein, partial [Steroidobacteraceae bacterium]|nr:ATP-binding cassette domain-containing protein [Steroidobacteraceae bacterium]
MLLEARSIDVRYGDLQALFAVSMELHEGEIVALVGANGAGKSTLLNTFAGLIPCQRGLLHLRAKPVGALTAEKVARMGIAL